MPQLESPVLNDADHLANLFQVYTMIAEGNRDSNYSDYINRVYILMGKGFYKIIHIWFNSENIFAKSEVIKVISFKLERGIYVFLYVSMQNASPK